MSMLPKRLMRYGLVLLATVVTAGCGSEGDGGTEPGTITLTIDQAAATIQQGQSQAVTATLTRAGGFTGTVNLDVTGEPTGVTATVSNVQTSGAVTTATVTILVGAAVAPALYPLVLHGTGSGVSAVTRAFALTVAAAPVPAYTLALSSPALSIVQGAATPTTTATLVRTNFTGGVTLSVENLPGGVTAAFNPASPISGSSSVLTLTVATNASTGTFTNLVVRGVATGLTDRTAPLSLTITAAPAPPLAGQWQWSITNAGNADNPGFICAITGITLTFTGPNSALSGTAVANGTQNMSCVFMGQTILAPFVTNSALQNITLTGNTIGFTFSSNSGPWTSNGTISGPNTMGGTGTIHLNFNGTGIPFTGQWVATRN
jgi:hypothetical protein